jgi:hypothetical protein
MNKGGLPLKRIKRKCQQLENIFFLLKKCLIEESGTERKVIVDFCSGGGHLGILIGKFF